MKLYNEEIFRENLEYEKISEIYINNFKIYDLTILYKFTNIHSLKIVNCFMEQNDFNIFDFTKFPNLEYLSLEFSYISSIHLCTEDLIKKISEKININLELAKVYYNNMQRMHCSKEIYLMNKKYFNERFLDSNFELVMDEIIDCCEEFEKTIWSNLQIQFEQIAFNKTIYDCKIKYLTIDTHQIKKFFENLPDECNLLNSLHHINTHESMSFLACSLNTFYENYQKKYYYDISNIEFDKDICKLALFKKLKNNIFSFINSDFYEYIAVDKCKTKKESELLPIDNIELYYKNHCVVSLIYNKPLSNKREYITHLKLQILDYDYAFEGFRDNKLKCMNNLPLIENLTMQCVCEFHDNMNSGYDSSFFEIDENLPVTLTNITLTGINQSCIDNIKKIPFGCSLDYELFVPI